MAANSNPLTMIKVFHGFSPWLEFLNCETDLGGTKSRQICCGCPSWAWVATPELRFLSDCLGEQFIY
jgi:hypothetical protein